MVFENDIVHPEGVLKEFGFAKMVADNSVLEKTGQLLVASRGAGVMVIYVSVKFRVGYPERPANSTLWEGLHDARALLEGTWGAHIHNRVARLRSLRPTWIRSSAPIASAHCYWPVIYATTPWWSVTAAPQWTKKLTTPP